MDAELLQLLEDAGAQVRKYHPLRWYTLGRMNNRTHRKLLVVDGQVGFTGGVGIADKWMGDAEDEEHWRDSHYRLEGPAVAQMQSAFLDNWMKTEGRCCTGRSTSPSSRRLGTAARRSSAAPLTRGARACASCTSCRSPVRARNVRISASYFVPDDLSVETLVAARRAGCMWRSSYRGQDRYRGHAAGVALALGAAAARKGSRSTSIARRCTTAR